MGLWPWGIFSQIFTPKFWKSVKADGLIQTYQRGHKAVMNTHTVGGNNLQRTKYVGMDQYGNKYYEDFDPLHINQTRWVEYNDYLSVRSPNGDMVPPKWHGWLAHQYDQVPVPESQAFQDPFFERPHEWNLSYSASKIHIPRMTVINDRALDYSTYRKNRYAKEWEPTTKRQ